MCMITVIDPLSQRPEINLDYLRIAAEKNKDGCGFAYVVNIGTPEAKVEIKKGMYDIEYFLKIYIESREQNPDSMFIVHQRNSTAGWMTENNCHPFVANDIAIAHNGTINKLKTVQFEKESDSAKLAKIVAELPKRWWCSDAKDVIFNLIQEFIGVNNRAAFLLPTNEVLYIGETGWNTHENILFSNTYYKKIESSVTIITPEVVKTQESKTATIDESVFFECNVCHKKAFISEGDKFFCENCFQDYLNKRDNNIICPICDKEKLLLDSEIKNGICHNCNMLYCGV